MDQVQLAIDVLRKSHPDKSDEELLDIYNNLPEIRKLTLVARDTVVKRRIAERDAKERESGGK